MRLISRLLNYIPWIKQRNLDRLRLTSISNELEAVSEQRSLERLALDSVSEGVVIFDDQGKIQYSNPSAAQLLGYETLEGNIRDYLPTEEGTNAYSINEILEELKLETESQIAPQTILINGTDGAERALEIIYSSKKTEQGTQYITTIKDRSSEYNLEVAARSVCHDLNNYLTPILGLLDLIIERLEELPQIQSTLKKINERADRIKDLVHTFHKLTRSGTIEFQPYSINKVVEEVLNDSDYRERATITTEYAETPESMGNERLLYSVIDNLIRNSIEAHADNIRIYTTYNEERNRIGLTIEDNGKGIKPEDISQVFSSNYTTKKGNQRLSGADSTGGLGLSACRYSITQHKGTIQVDREYTQPGKGTRFIIQLPVLKEVKYQ